jgi:hypothetical protein
MQRKMRMDAINKLIYKDETSSENEDDVKDVKSMEEILRKRQEKIAF